MRTASMLLVATSWILTSSGCGGLVSEDRRDPLSDGTEGTGSRGGDGDASAHEDPSGPTLGDPDWEMPGDVDDQPWVAGPGAYDGGLVFSRLYYNGALYGTSGEELFVAGEQFYPEVFGLAEDEDDGGSFVAVVGRDLGLRAWRPLAGLPYPQAFATNEAGQLVLAGQFYLDGLAIDGHTLEGRPDGGMYVVWLDRDLNVIDATSLAGELFPNDAALAEDGSVAIASTRFHVDEVTGEDVHVVCFSPERTLLWEQLFPGADTTWADKVEFLSDGTVAVVGAFKGSLTIDEVLSSPSDSYQGFATRLVAGTGVPLWDLSFGGLEYEYVTELNALGTSMRVGGHIEGSGTIGEFPFDVAEDGGTFIAEISSTGSISWLQTYDYLSGLDGMVTVGGVTTAFVTKTIGLMENELVLWTVTESEQATSSVQLGTKAYAEGLARDSAGNLWFGVLFQEAVTIPTGTFEHPRPSQFAQGTAFWRGIY